MNIYDYLAGNSYPGRGMIVGKYHDESVIAYFIMGRSENSRNRVFAKNGDILYTKAFDESKVKDPSLIIYNAIRNIDGQTIVTNGDQTDTIYDYLKDGKTMKDGLETRVYEPDEPAFTPRISSLIDENGNYEMSILRHVCGQCVRGFYHYDGVDGVGHFISTYNCDGNPLPSFNQSPIECEITLDIDEFGKKLWNSLNEDNKISLYVRYIGKDGYKDLIFNKNEM